ncbi:MAG: hypothetical protein Q9170_002686 [Blastenia crenularia]
MPLNLLLVADSRLAFSSGSQGLNSIEGFVAGSFVGKTLPRTPDFLSEASYLQELERHLARDHSGVTPFISVSQNLLRVLTLVFRRCREEQQAKVSDWNIAVINLSRLQTTVRAVWTLDAGIHSRLSFGEWVAYGAIPSSCVLSIVPVPKVLQLMSWTPSPFFVGFISKATNTGSARKAMVDFVEHSLTRSDGVAVGRLLLSLGIPNRFIGDVCTTILWDWRYNEAYDKRNRGKKREDWKLNSGFVQGLTKGYQQISAGFFAIAEEDEGSSFSSCDAFGDFLTQLEIAAFGQHPLGNARSDANLCPASIDEPRYEPEVKEEFRDCFALNQVPRYSKRSPAE